MRYLPYQLVSRISEATRVIKLTWRQTGYPDQTFVELMIFSFFAMVNHHEKTPVGQIMFWFTCAIRIEESQIQA